MREILESRFDHHDPGLLRVCYRRDVSLDHDPIGASSPCLMRTMLMREMIIMYIIAEFSFTIVNISNINVIIFVYSSIETIQVIVVLINKNYYL